MFGKFGSGSISKYIGVAVKLLTLDVMARATQQITTSLPSGQGRLIGSMVTMGVTLGRFAVLKKITSGLPFGLGALVNGLMTISAIQIVFSELPNLTSAFAGGGSFLQPQQPQQQGQEGYTWGP